MILKELLLFYYRPILLSNSIKARAEPLLACQLVTQVAITMVTGGLKELKEQRGSHLKSVKEVPVLNSIIINFPSSN